MRYILISLLYFLDNIFKINLLDSSSLMTIAYILNLSIVPS